MWNVKKRKNSKYYFMLICHLLIVRLYALIVGYRQVFLDRSAQMALLDAKCKCGHIFITDLRVCCCSCSWTTYRVFSCSLPSSCEIWTLPIISCFTVASRGGDVPQSSQLDTSHTIIRLTTQTQATTEKEVVSSANSTQKCYMLCHGASEVWDVVQIKK